MLKQGLQENWERHLEAPQGHKANHRNQDIDTHRRHKEPGSLKLNELEKIMKQEGPKSEQKTSWRTKTQAPPEISSLRIDGWGDKTCIIPQMEFMKLTETATLKLSDSTCNTLPQN